MSVIFDRRARVIALAVVLIVIGALGTIVSASLERCPTGCPPVNAGARSQGRKPGHLRCRGAQSNEGLSEHHRRHCDSTGRYLRHRHGHRHFDEPISDRAAAQRRLSVRTSPSVPGSWYWLDDQHAHWRPQHYFRPGTVVTAEANIYGTPLGNGLYGQEDSRATFTIGDAHVSIADDLTKQVSVYDNGALVRTMPTSMGMGGSETIGGQTISFWTQRGIYTVMDKANPVVMDSSTFWAAHQLPAGLPRNHQVRHPDQHRRDLSPSARCHGLGPGQHQRLPRLSEPQRRQRHLVLRILPARRHRGSPQHRR
jgi:hypothetical protein